MLTDIIDVYTDCIATAMPFAMVFFCGNLIVSTILTAAFGGKFHFGR